MSETRQEQGESLSGDSLSGALDHAVDQMRTTAKWILTLLAAVGAVLTAGVQLSSVGQLKASDPRLWLAVGALAVSLVSIGFIISRVVLVLAGGETSLDKLAEEEIKWGEKGPAADIRFAKETEYLPDEFPTVGDLREKYHEAKRKLREAEEDKENKQQAEIDKWDKELRYLTGEVMPQLFMGVRYYRVQRLFREAVRFMIWCGLIAAIGIVVFAWATNPPPSSANAPPFRAPVEASLLLTDLGRSSLSLSLGERCVSSGEAIEVLVLSYSEGRAEVVSMSSESCKLSRFPVVDGVTGTLQPKDAVELSRK